MPTTVDLQKMFKYSAGPITMAALALAVVTALIIAWIIARMIRNKKAGRKNTIKSLMWSKPDMVKLRQEYLAKLMNIEMEFDADTTRIRPAYEKMSVLIRDFVYRATGVEVLKYTLTEIKKARLESLAALIEEYYEPEFDKISVGDVKASIERTRKVISEWT
ncbi:MAG: hypothetical protein IJ757_02830 [Clostridiales bacterium]|nr:hypothetical protein [Clostridiales bacterium]